MHRLTRTLRSVLTTLVLATAIGACAKPVPVVRDPLAVEQYRARITKVRHAIDETQEVIGASTGSPNLPELYMRLAELTSEEARYHYMVAYEREQGRSEALHLPQVRILKAQAIATYRLVLDRYPDFPLNDRVVFSISQEQRELGEFDEMRKTLEELVAAYPDSRYRSEALLVLGDYHFDKAEFPPAKGYYEQILDLGVPALQGIAYYKLAWVHLNVGDCEQSFDGFERAIRASRIAEEAGLPVISALPGASSRRGEFALPHAVSGEDLASDYGTLDVQGEALVDLTYCYAQVREPAKAASYLRSQASTRETYVAALQKMARRFALVEQPQGAAEVSRELLRLAPDEPERLDDARMLHSAVTRMEDYSQVSEDVDLILRAMRRQLIVLEPDPEARALLLEEFDQLARDLSTRSHRMLTEGTESEWTENPANVTDTAAAYETYLATFPDSPYREEVVYNLADILVEGERFLEAGHRYREVAELLLQPPAELAVAEGAEGETPPEPAPVQTEAERLEQRREALYQSAWAYQQALKASELTLRADRVTARAGLRAAGGSYLSAGEAEPHRGRAVKFSMGRSHYDEGHHLEAIDLLTAVAYEYPGTEEGDAAAHLVLDAYHSSGDIPGLISAGRRFTSADSPMKPWVKSEIQPIVESAEGRLLDDLSLAASGEQPGGMEVLLTFAERYKDSDLGEQALIGTFVAARAGGDAGRLYEIGAQILERFPKSEQVSGVASTIGQTAASRYEFERAIDSLTMAADLTSDRKQAVTLLLTVGELQEQLADPKEAMRAYTKAMTIAPDARARSKAVGKLAAAIERWVSDPKKVVAGLTPLAEPFDPEVSARLGLALLRTGEQWEAEDHLRRVADSPGASAGARARADYGLAEAMLLVLEDFEPLAELDAIEELNGLVEIAVGSYLATIRNADPVFAQAALSRLARTVEIGADQLEHFPLPSTVTAEEEALLRRALSAKAEGLRSGRGEALAKCAQRAKSGFRIDEAGMACISGETPRRDPAIIPPLGGRTPSGALGEHADAARDLLSRNPDDTEALRTLGTAFLEAGDAHAARLVLQHLAKVGGEPDDLVLLGDASKAAGDTHGASAAYGRAMETGSAKGRRSLGALYDELGLAELAAEVRSGEGK